VALVHQGMRNAAWKKMMPAPKETKTTKETKTAKETKTTRETEATREKMATREAKATREKKVAQEKETTMMTMMLLQSALTSLYRSRQIRILTPLMGKTSDLILHRLSQDQAKDATNS